MKFTSDHARMLMAKIKAPLSDFTYRDVARGMNVELEHGLASRLTDITHDDPMMTLKIALAHLYERGDYYKLLERYVEGAPHPRGAIIRTNPTQPPVSVERYDEELLLASVVPSRGTVEIWVAGATVNEPYRLSLRSTTKRSVMTVYFDPRTGAINVPAETGHRLGTPGRAALKAMRVFYAQWLGMVRPEEAAARAEPAIYRAIRQSRQSSRANPKNSLRRSPKRR